MVDQDIIMAKVDAIRRHINRVKEKRNTDLQSFLADLDRQELVIFNLQMAIQNCIDMAAHIISEQQFGVPGSTNEMFYLLEESGYLEPELTERMVQAVGFRNIIVHEYGDVDLREVYKVAHEDIDDLSRYVRTVLPKLGIAA